VEPLPPELLPTVPHVVFGIFNLAIPNIIAWGVVIGAVLLAAWVRLPRFFEPAPPAAKEIRDEPNATSAQLSEEKPDL
jgi:hypothetical protein